MTCIVGLVEDGKARIGADSSAAAEWTVRAIRLPKVFRKGAFVIGYTSSFRMGQILQYHLEVAPQDDKWSDEEYMVQVFIESVRSCLKEYGFAKIESNVEEGGTFLVGYKGHIYHIYSDFQLNCYQDDLYACGSGGEYALGALMALEDLPPKERILRALKVAAHFSGNVVGPFLVLESGR